MSFYSFNSTIFYNSLKTYQGGCIPEHAPRHSCSFLYPLRKVKHKTSLLKKMKMEKFPKIVSEVLKVSREVFSVSREVLCVSRDVLMCHVKC